MTTKPDPIDLDALQEAVEETSLAYTVADNEYWAACVKRGKAAARRADAICALDDAVAALKDRAS